MKSLAMLFKFPALMEENVSPYKKRHSHKLRRSHSEFASRSLYFSNIIFEFINLYRDSRPSRDKINIYMPIEAADFDGVA
jgi:hypothetical protein